MKDSELFGRVRDDYDLQTKIHAEATKSRFNDMTVTHTWPRFSAAHQKHPAWNPAKAGEYFRQYMKASASVSDIADETRKIANDLTGILRTFNSDSDLTPAVEMIRGLDEREMRAVVMQMEWNASNVEGSANQAGEAAYRGVRDFFNRIPRSLQRQQWNDLAPIKEGDEVSVNAVDAEAILKSAVDNKHGEAMARIIASSYEPSFIVSQHLPQYSAATRKLTAQEAQEAEALRQQKLNDLHTLDQLTEFAEQTLDPIKAENAFMEYFALPVIQSAPVSLVSLIPGAGLAVNTLYYEDVAYNRMRREGASHEEASRYALTVGVLQSAAETVKVGALLGKLPVTRALVNRLSNPAYGAMRRYGTHLAVGVGGGTLTEQFQDQIIPALVQDVTKIGGDVSWLGREGVLMETVRTAPRAAAAVLLIGMGGSAVATAQDLQQRQHLFDSQDHLMASGLSEAQAVEVLGGVTFDDKLGALQNIWPERQGSKESIQAAAQRVEEGMTRDARAMQHLEELGVMPRVRSTPEGWQVQASGDGPASTFSDPADAEQLRADAVDHYERKGLEKVRESFQRPAAAQTTTSANANPDATPSPTDVTHSTANNSLSDAVATDSASAPASSAHAATASTSSPARSEADADVTLKADLAHAVAMNAATAPDVMTREMMHTATHLDKGEAGFSTRLREIAQVNPPASIGSGRARVQAAADSTANAILKKGVKGRQWLKQALRDAEQKTGIKLLPEDAGAAALSDAQLREAYGKASMLFFGLEVPRSDAAGGTRQATAAPSSTAKAATAAWKPALHESPLGHVLRADGRVHAAALKGMSHSGAGPVRQNTTPDSADKSIDSNTNEWYEYTHEQRQRFQQAARETEAAWSDAGRAGGLSPEQFAQVLGNYRQSATGEVLLVDQGIKPLYHEQGVMIPEVAQGFVESIRTRFPHLRAETWDLHVVVWHPGAVQRILDSDPQHYGQDAREAVRKAAENDEIGELLGNHARTRMAGDATVHYYLNGEQIAGGFVTQQDAAQMLGEQRRQVFEMTFGEPVTMEVRLRGKPAANDTAASQRDVETANAETERGRQAPNGQPSNLTEEQAQTVRTPEFKQQFGDWEAESNRAFLQGPPVASFLTDTIKDQGQGPIQAAKAWAEKYLPPFIKRPDLGRIITTPNTIEKSLSHKFGKVKLSAVTAIQQVLENGRVILSAKDKQGKPITHVLIAAPVEVDNAPYLMVARVKSDMNGKRFHIHELFLTEKIRELATFQSGPHGSQELLANTTGRKLYETILQDIFSVNPDTVSKIVDVNGEPLLVYPVGSQGGPGLTFTTDKGRASNEGALDRPVFLKGFTEGEDFSWDRGSGLITVNSQDQVIPSDPIDIEKHSSERASESFKDYEDYWIQNNPENKILSLIAKYNLSKHLSGKKVIYSGSKLGVSGGVHPLHPDVIKIYDEGLSFDDRYFVETLMEEIHHSKFLKLYPDSGLPRNNKWWNSFVEPRAKEYAKHYADRIFGSHEGN